MPKLLWGLRCRGGGGAREAGWGATGLWARFRAGGRGAGGGGSVVSAAWWWWRLSEARVVVGENGRFGFCVGGLGLDGAVYGIEGEASFRDGDLARWCCFLGPLLLAGWAGAFEPC